MIVERSRLRDARLFLQVVRPTVTGGCLLTYGMMWVAGLDQPATQRMVALFAVAFALGGPYLLAARSLGWLAPLRGAIFIDAVMIGLLVWGTGVPHMITIGYVWPVALAAYFFSWRLAVAALLFNFGLAAGVMQVAQVTMPTNALVSNMLGLVSVGALLVFLGASLRRHEDAMRLQYACDVATLDLASSHRPDDEQLLRFVAAFGRAMGADRALLRVFPTDHTEERIVQWTAEGVKPQPVGPLEPGARGPVMRGEPVWISSVDEADPALRDYLVEHDIGSGIGMPVTWEDEVVGLLSLQSRQPRDWLGDALPVLRRLVPSIGTILVQQRVLETQRHSLATLAELAALRERLVATTSHELRTPLTMVRGYLELMDRDDVQVSEADLAELRAAAIAATERLVRITDDLLELSRLRRQQPILDVGPVDLAGIVESCIAETCSTSNVECELPAGLFVHGDAARLRQAFCNLLGNAARYGDGRVCIDGVRSDGAIEISISDDGEGVPEEHHRELFAPFATFSGRPDSTGLGLAVTRAVVEAHGGTVRYRPAHGEHQHAFVVRLPARSMADFDASGLIGAGSFD